jgi:hypothetical protein
VRRRKNSDCFGRSEGRLKLEQARHNASPSVYRNQEFIQLLSSLNRWGPTEI